MAHAGSILLSVAYHRPVGCCIASSGDSWLLGRAVAGFPGYQISSPGIRNELGNSGIDVSGGAQLATSIGR